MEYTTAFFVIVPRPGSREAESPYEAKGVPPFALAYSDADCFNFSDTTPFDTAVDWGCQHDPLYMAAFAQPYGLRSIIRPEWVNRAPYLIRWLRELPNRPYAWLTERVFYYPGKSIPFRSWLGARFPIPENAAERRRQRWRERYYRDHEGFKERRKLRDQQRRLRQQEAMVARGSAEARRLSELRRATYERAIKETEIVYEDDFIGPCNRARLKRYNWLRTMVLKQDPIPIPD